MARTYANFDLVVAPSAQGYVAKVVASPAGTAESRFEPPFSALELENFRLKSGRLRPGMRRVESPEVLLARSIGTRLFESIFIDATRERLRASLSAARQQGIGLRLRVTTPSQLSDLPWEYLYSPELERFLSVSNETPVVRYLPPSDAVIKLPVTPPLRVLVMVATPEEYPPLDANGEWDNLQTAVADVVQRGLVTLERLERGTWRALQQRLRRDAFHVVHFIGHGVYDEQTHEGMLVFEGDDGRETPVSARSLGAVLHDQPTLRLVVLNACEAGRSSPMSPYGGAAEALVRAHVPAVIAMQFEISDAAAAVFASEFYGALAEGFPVDASLGEARKAMFADPRSVEWGTPALYTLLPDGELFDLTSSPVAGAVRSGVPDEIAETRAQTTDKAPKNAGRDRLRVSPDEATLTLAPLDVPAEHITDIFLSYARTDRARAKVLADALQKEGLSVWWDPKIRPGDTWRSTISNALKSVRCGVVLWSAASIESPWVLEEAEHARRRGILCPTLIDIVEAPIGFGAIQSANLVEWKGDTDDEEYQNLVAAIRAKLNGPTLVADAESVDLTAARVADLVASGALAEITPGGTTPAEPRDTTDSGGPREHAVKQRRDVKPGPAVVTNPAPFIDQRLIKPRPASRSSIPIALAPTARAWALPLVLLAVVFVANLAETAVETSRSVVVSNRGLEFASALHWLEGGYKFENQSLADDVPLYVYGYSSIYFFVFPLLGLAIAWALWRRSAPQPFQTYGLAFAIDYMISLPFFLLFPVPERWAFPDADSILVSDLWWSALIDAFRPISALDNCFPSFHTSMTVVMVLCSYLYSVRFRTAVAPLAAMVLVSTYVLGIHWIGDIATGTGVGVISVALAHRVVHKATSPTMRNESGSNPGAKVATTLYA
jgi:membrane-associated phospholipid phosphatase